jgi:DNA-binding CsgD family transcriptional regulator
MRYTSRQRRLSDPEIIVLYAELQDSDAVADRAGCSQPTVLAILRRAGVEVRPVGGPRGRRVRLAIPESEIIRMYRAGLIAREIAPRAGCSASVVYRILAQHGVERRKSPVGR